MAKYKIVAKVTGTDYEKIRSWGGLVITEKGSSMEITIEAESPQAAEALIKQIVGHQPKLIEGAKKIA